MLKILKYLSLSRIKIQLIIYKSCRKLFIVLLWTLYCKVYIVYTGLNK